ncbi:MAG: ribosome silencing factor [Arcobacter butzleri]|nr:ribosome silencing factor [Arcobacteraceae bacterium]MDY0364818.1 ribosome silencing factor [Arcobacteraceae bacterium]NLO17890.1 ribosome silencing factor [Aliarcobacter butzleri]
MEKRIEQIVKILDEKKGENIEVFDLTNRAYMVDFVVVATTLNSKHAFSLQDELKVKLKPLGEEFLRVDEDENWTIIDLGDLMIHLISENYRQKYHLDDFLKEIEKTNS